MSEHIEEQIKEIVESIYKQEMFYYCSFCKCILGRAELEKDIFCKYCGSVTVDLREYIS